ncbi:MAG: DNA translocase FtsK 4TM domain-containing protein [Candidatus Paceibacterota bacterium]
MGRKKKIKEKEEDLDLESTFLAGLKEDTKHAIFGVLFITVGIFFLLAKFDYAGLAGRYTYNGLDFLLGAGYLILPLILTIIGVSFFLAVKTNFLLHRIIGGTLLFISALGIFNIALNDDTAGGLIGRAIAGPLLTFFDFYVSLVVLISAGLIAVFVIFDTRLSFENSIFGFRFGKKDEGDIPEDGDDDLIIKNGATEEDETDKDAVDKPVEKNRPAPANTNGEESGGFLSGVMSFTKKSGGKPFTQPPLSLLSRDRGKPGVGDIKANSNIIKRTLANFSINVEMDEISIGPSITRYALKPAEGVKLSRILNLQNDLALALAAHPIRIEAPIPGRSLVGIEIPNTTKTTVGLGSILSSKEFSASNLPLLIGLGRGISGESHFANVAKAPHMLIAGATGSGKSVTIHTLVTSLLYRNPPERLRFLMIDPKRVELTLYNKTPHLLTPVITDPKKAIMALRWATKEMERRYALLEEEAVRDIQSYHTNVLEPALKKGPEEGEDIELMPYIVVIIDELADIMSTYPRELEAAVVRLAQMSRAVGIHLVLSTQRPSVEVITGLIKANIPCRIALQVASQIDSRTILDSPGAEKLLGAGDMLYLSGEMSKAIRLQSAFISEDEVKKVVRYIIDQQGDTPPPDQIILDAESASSGKAIFSSGIDGDDDDDLYEDARAAVLEASKASASYLQRKLRVGYARAARLLDMLEERGVVGPADGAKPRDVYGANSKDDYAD